MDHTPADASATAIQVLRDHWATTADVLPVSVGVNRQVWRAGSTFLVCAWPDERPAVERELELCQALHKSRDFTFEVPSPVLTIGEQPLVEHADRIWWRTQAVEGVHPDPTDPAQVRAVAASLARLHSQLRTSAVAGTVQVIQFACWPDLALNFLGEHPELFDSDEADVVRHATDVVKRNLPLLARDRQLVHGDPSFPNIVCSRIHSEILVTGFLDWQEAAVDTVLTDLSVLGNTIWQRSKTSSPLDLLVTSLSTYHWAGGDSWDVEDVFVAMLTAKLQSVAHHGRRYIEGKGPRGRLAEQPGLIADILQAMQGRNS